MANDSACWYVIDQTTPVIARWVLLDVRLMLGCSLTFWHNIANNNIRLADYIIYVGATVFYNNNNNYYDIISRDEQIPSFAFFLEHRSLTRGFNVEQFEGSNH